MAYTNLHDAYSSFQKIGTLQTHRTGLTAADSGNDPAGWSGNPSAYTDMSSHEHMRLRINTTAGALSSISIAVVTVDNGVTNVSQPMVIIADFSEPILFKNYAGYSKVYIKLVAIAGGATVDFTLQAYTGLEIKLIQNL